MKYRVIYSSVQYFILDVEADSIEEAKNIAENTDSGDFIDDGVGDWYYEKTLDEDGNALDSIC